MAAKNAFDLRDAFTIYSAHRGAILQMWGFYSLATLGLIAWALGGATVLPPIQRWTIIGGYTAFAIGNAVATVSSQGELRRMAEGLRQMSSASEDARFFISRPISPVGFIVFYVIVTAFVDIAIATRGLC